MVLPIPFTCVVCGGQNCGKGLTQRLCQPLNWCDLAHALPFTLPGGYALDLHTLDGQASVPVLIIGVLSHPQKIM